VSTSSGPLSFLRSQKAAILFLAAPLCYHTTDRCQHLKLSMEYWGKEVCGEPRRTKNRHQDCLHSTESLGRAETIVTTRTDRTLAAARPASTEDLKMRSLEKIMTAVALGAGLTVQKAQKVRRRSRTTWRWPGTCRGAAAGATAACELREKTSWTWEAWLDVTPHHTIPTIYILLYIGAVRLRSRV